MNNYTKKKTILETFNEYVERRNIEEYNDGYDQALIDVLEMIENDFSYDEVYESIGEYLEEVIDTKTGATIGAIGGGTLGATVGTIAGGAGGLVAGGKIVNKKMKEAQAKKLAALKASGASDEEIAKMVKRQKRNRVLGTIGGVVGGGLAGSQIGSVGGALVGGGAGAIVGRQKVKKYNKQNK